MAAKAALRAEARQRRQQAAAAAPQAAAALTRQFRASVPLAGDACVAGYVAINGEIDPLPLLAALDQEGRSLCLPAVMGRGTALAFRRWHPGEPLAAGAYGTWEPLADAPLVVPSLILVPLLAFDARGHRLGYGGGYYDRTVARLRRLGPLLAIGLAYEAQRVADLPSTEHDQRLDAVLTEAGFHKAHWNRP